MDKSTIDSMLKNETVAKEPRVLVCSCGKSVKVGRYRITATYKCNSCRHPKERT